MTKLKVANSFTWITFACFIAFNVFLIFGMKFRVENLEKELFKINQSIASDIQAIHVLNAEWSLFNSPGRIRHLAQKHIFMKPTQPEQIINYSALPLNTDNEQPTKLVKAER